LKELLLATKGKVSKTQKDFQHVKCISIQHFLNELLREPYLKESSTVLSFFDISKTASTSFYGNMPRYSTSTVADTLTSLNNYPQS
jgi:hypothetical protein